MLFLYMRVIVGGLCSAKWGAAENDVFIYYFGCATVYFICRVLLLYSDCRGVWYYFGTNVGV